MKLSSIQLRQFRRFQTGIDITDLESGITVLHGPNESGKSTLAQAIRAGFFERHSSGTLSGFQPWGDSAASPEVRLTFEFNDVRHQLTKQFVRKKRCDLSIDGRLLNGDEAEQYLADLMGYSMPSRGASKPEHWGVPGLLWIEQGHGHQLQESVLHASEHLQGILNDAMGHVASSDGDRILQVVSERLAQLQTRATGAPTRDYRKAIEEKEQVDHQILELDATIRTYQDYVDQLDALQVQHQRDEHEQPWQELRQKEGEARKKLDGVNVMRDEQKREQDALAVSRQTQELLRQQLQTFRQQVASLHKREHELGIEQVRHQELAGQADILRHELDRASEAYTQARELLARSRQDQQRRETKIRLAQLQDELLRIKDHVKQAKQLSEVLDADQQRATQLYADPDILKKLHALHDQLQSLDIRQQTIATRLNFDLQEGQTVELDDKTVSGTAEHLLLNQTRLTIPGVGQIQITPGGEDVASLARERERVSDEWALCLQQLNVATLEQARQRAADYAELSSQIRQHQAMLALHAPEGVVELERRQTALTEQLIALQHEYQRYSDQTSDQTRMDAGDVAQAQRAEQQAEQHLKTCEARFQAHRVAMATVQAALAAARREVELAQDVIRDENRKATEQQVVQRLDQELAREQALETRVAQLQNQIDAVRPDLLEQDIRRYSQSAARLFEEHAERQRVIRELKGRLQAMGAQGLEEQRNALAVQQTRLGRRVAEFARHAAALSLLQGLLQEKRQVLTRQLHAPLKKKLLHYLGVLFGRSTDDVDVMLDDQLMPVSLTRQDAQADLHELSFGAREQMGLISRLAYADLLKEAGRPTLIMLDDALVHSDALRLAQMKRILFDAATRHQILLFTCHPEKWRDIGVTPRAIQDLVV